MLKSKTFNRICCATFAAMLLITVVVWVDRVNAGRQTITMGYEGLFSRDRVHTINIEMNADEWAGFIRNAASEEYRECSVTIDGEKLSNVAIRAKGNTSLSSVSGTEAGKYSFKIEFDQYVSSRKYRGLDKLSLNNLIYDATMMKDYLAYTLMSRAGVPSPLCSFAQITVNGEPWGLYLAVEGVEDGFMERNNMTTGELYKPDSMSFGGGRGNGRDFDFEQFRVKDDDTDSSSETEAKDEGKTGETSSGFTAPSGGFSGQMPSGMTPPQGFSMPEGMSLPDSFQTPEGMSGNPGGASDDSSKADSDKDRGIFQFGGGMFNFGMGSNDVKLQYIDDDPDSYSNIFNNAKTDVGKKDKARLIETLKTLNSENAQDAVFTDEVIRYLAVHDFLQNGDSYTGMMVHNYYLYEEDGKLAILPWDYNLAFGGMSGGDAASTVNSPIDTPVSNGIGTDRPLISWIFQDEEATAKYHEVYSQFIADTVESGWLASEISRVSALIRPHVEADANSFYSVEEFDAAVEALQSYCALRGESIRGQLEGTIPSTSAGQRTDTSALVDTGDLSLSAMGTMNMGGGAGGNGAPSMPGNSFPMSGSSFSMPSGSFTMPSGSFTPPSGFSMPGTSGSSSDASASTAATQAPEQAMDGQRAENKDAEKTTVSASENGVSEAKQGSDRSKLPEGGFPSGMPQNSGAKKTDWLTFGCCLALLFAALIVMRRIRGHNG